ncbi:NAD-dependent epimerase/dehydratase family protein [Mycolicibacterium porcinum]|uniref:NAD-dependent epimerase/dehydratase family protein n=1 Tax=Mycolicibacterium porcinum TaxID=39693 RepID=UPI0011932EAC|nr:NAD-dependent epimerase/dehydratase family protein [Mycolicibacterium porcinum]
MVTGGSGFVGEHLVRRLAGDGHAVLALARPAASADMPATWRQHSYSPNLATSAEPHVPRGSSKRLLRP